MSRRRNAGRKERRRERAAIEAEADQLMVLSRVWAERAALLDAAGYGARARAAERNSVDRAIRAELSRMGVPYAVPLPAAVIAQAEEALSDLALGDAAGAEERRQRLFRLLDEHRKAEATT